jgi:TP901 family phage tail tape measure protein
MATPINLPVNAQLQNQTQLQRQIQQATQNLRINFATGNSARSLGALSQPLGRLTGQADEFSKSLDAANARVLAFGASVGIVNTLSNAFKSLVASTIEVEKAITAISVVGDQFAGKNKQLSQGLFSIAKATGQSFQEVSKAALEFSRQGLSLEDTLQRTQNALILTRLTGLDAAKAVDGLTASVNAFSKAGLNTTQIINKLAAVDQAFAVSSADLIEGFNRSAAVAQNAGVTFDELAGIITALQQETSRGGAVIGNALKTIFTRLQDTSTLNQLKNLGVAVQDLQGNLLPARQILQNLATDIEGLGQITKAGVFKDVAGTFQINQLISLVGDLGKENSVAAAATRKAAGATNEAFIANEKLNQSLDAILNKIANAGQQFGSLLGEIGITDGFRELLGYIDSFLEGANKLLQGDDLGSRFAKGLVKGIGSVLTGPGIGIILAVIAKLGVDLAKFGVQSLKTFFGIGQAARDQQKIQESIVQTLIRNQSVLSQILNTQGGQNAQAQTFLNILRQEEQVLQNIRTIAGGIAAPLISQGYRAGAQGIQRRSAGGYLPAQEASDVRRGVGGASPNSKVVAIPNFAFGGGKRGTMIANTSEYIVPNYAGGGSAIFNQDMAKTMGLPPGAKKITASGGFVPNFNTEKLKQGNILEKDIFSFFGLSPAGNRNLDFPRGLLDSVNGQKKLKLGFQGSYGDLKLTQSQENKTSLLGRLIQEFDLFQELKSLSFKKRNSINVNLNSLAQKVGDAALFYQGNPADYRKETISSTFSAIRKSNRDKPNFLKAFDSIIYNSDGKLKPFARGSKVSASVFLDGVSSPKNSASSGYIPNFAGNYIYDSDRLSGNSKEILAAILQSTKKKDLLVGPAGAGKSTLGSGLGTFISSIDDISKASSFTILSGAALTKEKGLSQDLRAKLAAVQASGGKVSYLGVTNQELLSRREKRATGGSVEGDLRSAAQLAGSKFAPLNQGAFIKQLKRSSSNFELLR